MSWMADHDPKRIQEYECVPVLEYHMALDKRIADSEKTAQRVKDLLHGRNNRTGNH